MHVSLLALYTSCRLQVPMEEALKRTLRHFSHLHADKQKDG